jgi:heat shock factor-binding protein 1
MLQQMQTRFGEMNTSIVQRIDEMGKKIDELESSIGELIQEAQNEEANNK